MFYRIVERNLFLCCKLGHYYCQLTELLHGNTFTTKQKYTSTTDTIETNYDVQIKRLMIENSIN